MDGPLVIALLEDDFSSLLDRLTEDPLVLDRCLMEPFTDNPLHIAAMLGNERFVTEILARKPELAREPNAWKSLPLHLAVEQGDLGLVRKILSVHPDACYARDQTSRNPLHVAALKGRVDILTELVQQRPEAALQKTEQGDTLLHLCVRRSNVESVKLLVDSIEDAELINSKNEYGETARDVAATYNQTEIFDFLSTCQNNDGFTAGAQNNEAVVAPPEIELQPETVPPQTEDTGIEVPSDKTMMVVAILTATLAFGGISKTPGGFVAREGEEEGFPVMAYVRPYAYMVFLGFNGAAAVVSLSVIILLLSTVVPRVAVSGLTVISLLCVGTAYNVALCYFTPGPVGRILGVLATGFTVVYILFMILLNLQMVLGPLGAAQQDLPEQENQRGGQLEAAVQDLPEQENQQEVGGDENV